MCAGCRSSSQGPSEDLNDKPFGTLADGSMGDAGVAMKASDKYDGPSSQNEKYELSAPTKNASASQVANVGRQ